MGRVRSVGARRMGAVGVVAIVVALVLTACEPPGWRDVPIRGFEPERSYPVDTLSSDQGLATVRTGPGQRTLVYTGETIPAARTAAGWTHIGDPDSRRGYVVYPWQANAAAKGKLFQVVTPSGQSYDYVHPLDPGEELNNSFAAVSPNGRWLVSGEYDVESRLLVFPMPILNRAVPAGGGPLALASTIQLDHPVTNIQGCTFASATRLICSADDDVKQLVSVRLSAPLSRRTTQGVVTSLGRLPQISSCQGTFEAEGLDFDLASRTLRVQVIRPGNCILTTDVYQYRQRH